MLDRTLLSTCHTLLRTVDHQQRKGIAMFQAAKKFLGFNTNLGDLSAMQENRFDRFLGGFSW